ncbi:hypothetical protein ABE488_09005 [Luteimonas sp. TWI662]|uniref:hypothetical protein n=1 Tax=Luteimonas sp. TWI662 TaxID=3136789 RepID=UPI00320B8A81
MIGPILQFEDLQRLCQPDPAKPAPRRGTVEAWARRIGLSYTYDGHGGIITTITALNSALGVGQAAANDGVLGPDDL